MGSKKQSILSYCGAPLCALVINIVCSIILVVLQSKCMNHKENSFVDSYCMNDNSMRAVVSLVLVAMVIAIAYTLSSAVRSFRTYKLLTGINEGIFVAMGSGICYRIRSLTQNKWACIIIGIVLLEFVPLLSQILANLAITTEMVYVKSDFTAEVIGGPVNYGYNAAVLKDLSAAMPPSSNMIASTAPAYGSALHSVVTSEGVEATVVREGLAMFTSLNATRQRSDYSFAHTDVVARVSTRCNQTRDEGIMFPDTENRFSKIEVDNTRTGVYANSTYSTDGKHAYFSVLKKFFFCIDEKKCNVTTTLCNSRLLLSRDDIIYTVNNRKTTSLRTVDYNTTISISDFANITNRYITAPEDAATGSSISAGSSGLGLQNGASNPSNDLLGSLNGVMELLGIPVAATPSQNSSIMAQEAAQKIPPDTVRQVYVLSGALESNAAMGVGLFDSVRSNELHARVLAAAAVSLMQLQVLSYVSQDVASGSSASIVSDSIATASRVFKNVSLYGIKNQAYMPPYFAWLVSVLFVLSASLLTAVNLYSFNMSPINVKDANELALIDNVGNSMRLTRAEEGMSNDTHKPERFAFEHTMYCREDKQSNTVIISYNNAGSPPNKHTFYN